MGTTAVAIAKVAVALLSDEKTRKAIGWTLVAILAPLILLIAVLCSLGSGAAEHNAAMVNYCFYGGTISDRAPAEYRNHIEKMGRSFSLLDTAINAVNRRLPSGMGLDATRIKSIFFTLCVDDPDHISASQFVGCFFVEERHSRTVTVTNEDGEEIEKEETYTVTKTVSQDTAYSKLSAILGRSITEDDQGNINRVYTLACGYSDSGSFDGDYQLGGAQEVALNISGFIDPTTKNAHDLVVYVKHAWISGWGYVWGTYGNVLTPSLLDYKLQQYPDGVGKHESFIRSHWVGGRTADCVGLIKGYGWLDTDTLTICYGSHGMPDIGANTMCRCATVKGPIRTMPDIPGLAVWMDGHIGVYIGGGEVIEAMGTRYGVVKTQLEGRGWTHWLEIPYISYTQ